MKRCSDAFYEVRCRLRDTMRLSTCGHKMPAKKKLSGKPHGKQQGLRDSLGACYLLSVFQAWWKWLYDGAAMVYGVVGCWY